MGVPLHPPRANAALLPADLIIDTLLGYSLEGAPRGGPAQLISEANEHDAPVLSLDLPSGVEATAGTVHTPTIRADATLTLALPKEGLRAPEAVPYVGELYLGDIGVPPVLYSSPSLGLKVGYLFAAADIIRLW